MRIGAGTPDLYINDSDMNGEGVISKNTVNMNITDTEEGYLKLQHDTDLLES